MGRQKINVTSFSKTALEPGFDTYPKEF